MSWSALRHLSTHCLVHLNSFVYIPLYPSRSHSPNGKPIKSHLSCLDILSWNLKDVPRPWPEYVVDSLPTFLLSASENYFSPRLYLSLSPRTEPQGRVSQTAEIAVLDPPVSPSSSLLLPASLPPSLRSSVMESVKFSLSLVSQGTEEFLTSTVTHPTL